jgi:glycosyltransferase involved in cell wall biosynthesis|tara:strand:+ start:302 stop:499 length:198 start_codon:yes stop_codon:yes gene_type:complete
MKLGILVHVYNEESTFSEINSCVLSQRINGIEALVIVIVDDCSSGGINRIIKDLELSPSGIIKAV